MSQDTKTGQYWMIFPKSKEAKDACIKHGLRLYDSLYDIGGDKKKPSAKEALKAVIDLTDVRGFSLAFIDIHRTQEEIEQEGFGIPNKKSRLYPGRYRRHKQK